MKIGFALITASPYFDKIVALENQLHNQVHFHNKLELQKNIPHTTLFQGNFSDNTDYIIIADKLAHYIRTQMTDQFLHFSKVIYVPSGWYFYICKKTKELQELHNYTLSECNAYLALDPHRLDRDHSYLTDLQIEGIRNYGYRYAGKAFYPHITLGRTSFDEQKEVIKMFSEGLSRIPSDIPVHKLTVYKMGADGMHAETLYELNLS